MLRSHRWQINNIDATIAAQSPSLSPYIHKMREKLSQALDIGKEQVSIKATTTEGLGFIGRGEGIAAHAIALIAKLKEPE
jgi:2-C-methyl-D-erythritol 2,4-cyclodiphosphate synthase